MKIKKESRKQIQDAKASGEAIVEEEISGEVEKISVGREKLSQAIAEAATKELKKFGIDLIDVQLRRISYENLLRKSL